MPLTPWRDGDTIRSRVANHARRELDLRLNLPTICVERLANVKRGQGLRHGQEQRVVRQDAPGADAPPKPEYEGSWIGGWFVVGRLKEALWLEGERIRVFFGVVREMPAGDCRQLPFMTILANEGNEITNVGRQNGGWNKNTGMTNRGAGGARSRRRGFL